MRKTLFASTGLVPARYSCRLVVPSPSASSPGSPAVALPKQSKAKTALGDHAGGLAALHEAHGLAEELARQAPQDFRLQRGVWLTETLICELLIDEGDAAETAPACLKTIPFPEAALAREPENGVVAYDLAISHFNTARGFRLAGDPAQTVPHAQRAIEVMSALSAKSPASKEHQRNSRSTERNSRAPG